MHSLRSSPSEALPISAYIPCYNNAKTVELTIQGIREQTYPVRELFVVDDASTDDSVDIVKNLGVRVVRLDKNQGRGPVRARAMEEAEHEFVLCCDATNRLSPQFLEKAMPWFSGEDVCAVYGRWFVRNAQTPIDRWRARHLFHQDTPQILKHRHHFCTHGAVLRKSAAMRAGNYNSSMRHGEDYDLGLRLLEAGGDVIFDPALEVEPVVKNTLFQVMERYIRWNQAASEGHYSFKDFIKSHVLAWKILIPQDLKKGDWPAAFISAILPYFALILTDRTFSKVPSAPTQKTAAPITIKN